MNTNEYNGVSQQTSDCQNNNGYAQTPNYQNNNGYGQTPNYQNNNGYGQTPNYQNNNGYGQTPNYQNNNGYGQVPNYQNNNGYGQTPNYQNNNGYEQAPVYQNAGAYQQAPNHMYQGNVSGNGSVSGNNQKPPKAPNIFKQFAFSFVPPKYNELARAKVGVMILLIFIVVFLMVGLDFSKTMLGYLLIGGAGEVLDLFPYFEVEDGEFYIEQVFYVEEGDVVMYMTDDIDEFDYYDVEYYVDDGFEQVMLVGRENMCIYDDNEYQEMYFYELGDVSFSKDDLEKWTGPFMWIVLLIGYAFIYVSKVFWYFLCASVYLLIGMLMALIFSKSISAGHIFKAAVFAKIPFFIIAALFKLVGLDFGILGVLRALLTLAFFGFCVWFLPSKQR